MNVGIAEGMQPDDAGSEVFLGHSGGVSPSLLALWTPLHLSVLLTAYFRSQGKSPAGSRQVSSK